MAAEIVAYDRRFCPECQPELLPTDEDADLTRIHPDYLWMTVEVDGRRVGGVVCAREGEDGYVLKYVLHDPEEGDSPYTFVVRGACGHPLQEMVHGVVTWRAQGGRP